MLVRRSSYLLQKPADTHTQVPAPPRPPAVPRLLQRRRAVVKPEFPVVLGIDASLSCTGYSYRGPDSWPVASTIQPGELRGSYRLSYVRRQMERIVQEVRPSLAVIEGYSMGVGRGAGRLADLGELGGVIKLLLWENGVDVMIVPPSTLKSGVALNGRASKEDLQKALDALYGYIVTQDDEADAVGLMLLGEFRLGSTELKADAKRRRSVENCEIVRGQIKL